MSWHFESTTSGGVIRGRVTKDGAVVTRADALAAMADDASFRSAWTAFLRDAPFRAFFLETPPTTRAHQHLPFELVLIDAPPLAVVRADETSFASELVRAPQHDVLTFPNLGGDAVLVVPAPRGPNEAYAHLAAFVRLAPPDQVDATFVALARAIEASLDAQPLWVSTAGLGVAWLHLRLDSRPKYYRYAVYKSPP